MPDISPQTRIGNLKAARAAAQAVVDEITRLDTVDPVPTNILLRQPKSLQAQGDVADLSDVIDDEEAAALVVTVDDAQLADLQTLAAKLDKAIVSAALRSGGLAAMTTVLNGVAQVRGILNA
jgi:hypothetical protein